jgi:hypothetical protein
VFLIGSQPELSGRANRRTAFSKSRLPGGILTPKRVYFQISCGLEGDVSFDQEPAVGKGSVRWRAARYDCRTQFSVEVLCAGVSARLESPALHVKYRYGNFYNCPVEEKGISVTGEACCMLA